MRNIVVSVNDFENDSNPICLLQYDEELYEVDKSVIQEAWDRWSKEYDTYQEAIFDAVDKAVKECGLVRDEVGQDLYMEIRRGVIESNKFLGVKPELSCYILNVYPFVNVIEFNECMTIHE